MVIQDAQGNRIRTTETRANITFEFQRTDGRVIKVRDSAVFGDVTQPLFAVGKLWKVGWGLDPLDQFNAFLKKGGARVPVRFVRNSTVTRPQDLQSTSEGGKRRRTTSEKVDVDQADGRRLRKDEVSRRMVFHVRWKASKV